jgi:hypothetical protein
MYALTTAEADFAMTKSRRRAIPGGMTAVQYAFALECLANGGNATAAYRKDHPQASDAVCQVEGWRY